MALIAVLLSPTRSHVAAASPNIKVNLHHKWSQAKFASNKPHDLYMTFITQEKKGGTG